MDWIYEDSRRRIGRQVLVVDDNEGVMNMVSGILRDAGYEARATTDPEEALRISRERPPSLIMTDVGMRDRDGFDLCDVLKAHPRTKRIPVLFLSGRAGDSDPALGRRSGGVAYLDKPFSRQALLSSVKRVLEECVPSL